MSISPLLHLIPIGVVITLVFSWAHLLKHIAVRPHKVTPEKKPPKKPGKRAPKPGRSFFQKVSCGLKGVSRRWRRLFFAQAAVKSTICVFAVFVVIIFATYVLAYPNLIGDSTLGLYHTNSSALGFVTKTIEVANGIGRALAPLGWLASAIDGALKAAAPGFRNVVQSFGALAEPLVRLDKVGKYIVCQNVAAWTPALITLIYGRYTSTRRYRFKRK